MAGCCDQRWTLRVHACRGLRLVPSRVRARAGTFLYVAFMEVIPRELAAPAHRSAKLAMLILGFGAMSLLGIWA